MLVGWLVERDAKEGASDFEGVVGGCCVNFEHSIEMNNKILASKVANERNEQIKKTYTS